MPKCKSSERPANAIQYHGKHGSVAPLLPSPPPSLVLPPHPAAERSANSTSGAIYKLGMQPEVYGLQSKSLSLPCHLIGQATRRGLVSHLPVPATITV